MIGRFVDPERPDRADRTLAAVRLAALPIIFIGERLVGHPAEHTALFEPLLGAAAIYSLAALAASRRTRPLPSALLGALDFSFLCALVYTSGGPFSQARFAFFLVPLVAALVMRPRVTAAVSAVAVAAYVTISAIHPATDSRSGALDFELAQAAYLVLAGIGATLFAQLLAERTHRIAELAASRNRLVAQALDAEDRERRRLAEALHDDAIQNLLAARQELASANPAGTDLELVRECVDRTVVQLREAVFELHPYVLEHGGLGPALRAVADQHARRVGFGAQVEVDPAAEGAADDLLFSVGRELLANAAKHSEARRVTVTVRRIGDEVKLEVADDGRGADPETLRRMPVAGHIGLASCAERVEAVGGHFELDTARGRGLRAMAVVPAAEPVEPTIGGQAPRETAQAGAASE